MAESDSLRFFDCNTFIGTPATRAPWRPVSATELIAEMDRAGIERALVWHITQHDGFPLLGNDLVDEAVAAHHDRLAPCWTLLPTQSGELGDLDEWLSRAGAAGVKALRAWPKPGRYLLRWEVIGDLLAGMVARRVPLIYAMASGEDTWAELHDLLASCPELRVILSYENCWSADRLFRPLVERYRNVYVDISAYYPPGGIEAFVRSYGPERMLFGTGFPVLCHGAMMLTLAHADIPFEDKQAIAAGNIEQLLEEVEL
jgi:hypothetical protein